MASVKDLPVAGWREWVQFPELNVSSIKAKLDTGARTSALHASDIRVVEREGIAIVTFNFHPSHKRPELIQPAQAPMIAQRWVRSSSGHVELRPVIRTLIQLGEHRWPIELTLTGRHDMGFRLLLGRQALRGHYVVDPGRSYLRGHQVRIRRAVRSQRAAQA
jgi:hypothetical protein